MLLELRGNFYI